MNKLEQWIDSYGHYRKHVGLTIIGAIYRATYYELHHSTEPKKWRGVV